MKKTLKRTLLLTLATMALSSLSFAGPILCGGAPQTIAAISGGGGCTYGSNLVSNVSIAGSTESGALSDAIDQTKVQLTLTGATTNPGVLNVTVSNSDTASWALTGTQQFDLILTYSVTGSAAYFSAFADSFNGSGTGAISYDKTANGQTLSTLTLANMSNAPLVFAGAPLSTFNVTDNIQVHASSASVTLTNATNSFTMVTIFASVPEPMTSTLLGSGLLALGLMLRRKRSS